MQILYSLFAFILYLIYLYMEQKPTFTSIESIGRSGLIEKLSGSFPKHEDRLIFGSGDDAAVIKPTNAEHMLLSSELFAEGVDFDLTYSPLQHLGFKLVSITVSDIFAMNGVPDFILVNLGLTNKISVEMAEAFYRGVKSACDLYQVKLAGGDVAAANTAMTISITASGYSDNPVYRSGAKEGDAICVTGDLGAAASGLMILLREKKHWESSPESAMQPELEPFEYVVRKQLVPEARHDLITAFNDNNIVPSSMIDLSQGLNKNLLELASASNTGAMIYEAAIPVSPQTRFAADELEEDIDKFVLYGGEETELLFTLPEKTVKAFSEKFRDFVVIGRMVNKKEGVKMQTAEGSQMTLHA